MDFIVNIMPGAEGASSAKLNVTDKSDESGGDENSLFAALVSKNGSEAVSATPKAEVETPDGPVQGGAALPVENLVMTASGHIRIPGDVPGPGQASGPVSAFEPVGIPGFVSAPGAVSGPVDIPNPEGIFVAARVQGEMSTGKPGLPLKTEADKAKADRTKADPAGAALKVKSSGLISTWKETAAVRQAESGGEEKTAPSQLENPLSGFAAVKSDLPVKDIAAGQPAGFTAKSHIETVPQSGLIAAKANMAKTALQNADNAPKAIPVLKAASDMNPADPALAVLAKMGETAGGKTGLDLTAARVSGAEIAKTAEIAVSSTGIESSLGVAAEKPQSFHTILQSHQVEAKPAMLPVNAVAVEIARRFNAGANKFQIRLDPPELGRIDVRMDVSKEGRVRAHMIVEKPETLVALNRDSAALERALNDSGLETRENALNFSLSGGNHNFEGEGKSGGFGAGDEADIMSVQDIETLNGVEHLRGYISSTGVDIHV